MEDVQEKERTKTLLERYDLVLENLSFEYIAQCENKKELERILKVLRSGEEGVYPALMKSCEDKLAVLFPSSRLLMVPQEVLMLSEKEEREDIQAYSSVIKQKDELLIKNAEAEAKTQDIVPVRQANIVPVRQAAIIQETEKPPTNMGDGDKRTKNVMPRSYADWDKFDADEELLKMDLEEERKTERKEKKNKMSKNTRRKVGKYPSKEEAVTVAPKDALTPCEQEALARIEKLKGNECYKAKDYETALTHYSRSIALHPTVDHYNNRAAAHLKLENMRAAVSDCSEALSQDPWNVKALYRRGTAHRDLHRLEDAVQDLQDVLRIDPNNTAATQMLSKLRLESHSEQQRDWENQAGSSAGRIPTSRRMLIQELD